MKRNYKNMTPITVRAKSEPVDDGPPESPEYDNHCDRCGWEQDCGDCTPYDYTEGTVVQLCDGCIEQLWDDNTNTVVFDF